MKTYRVYFSIGKKKMCFTNISAKSKKQATEIIKSRIKFIKIEEKPDSLDKGSRLFNQWFGKGV